MNKELFNKIVKILKEKHKGTYTYNADVKVVADGTKFLFNNEQIFEDIFEITNVSYDEKSNVLSFKVWYDEDLEGDMPYLDVYLDEDCAVCYYNDIYNDYLDDMYYFDTDALNAILKQI